MFGSPETKATRSRSLPAGLSSPSLSCPPIPVSVSMSVSPSLSVAFCLSYTQSHASIQVHIHSAHSSQILVQPLLSVALHLFSLSLFFNPHLPPKHCQLLDDRADLSICAPPVLVHPWGSHNEPSGRSAACPPCHFWHHGKHAVSSAHPATGTGLLWASPALCQGRQTPGRLPFQREGESFCTASSKPLPRRDADLPA